MAIDTKPNLSSSKFEQLSGDTLGLSGRTEYYGTAVFESGSTLTILKNRGAGKVLVSDADGKMGLQVLSGATVSGVAGNLPMIGPDGMTLVDSGINAYLVYAGL